MEAITLSHHRWQPRGAPAPAGGTRGEKQPSKSGSDDTAEPPLSRPAVRHFVSLLSFVSLWLCCASGADGKTQTPPIKRFVSESSSDLRLSRGKVQHHRCSAECPGLACFQLSLVQVGLSAALFTRWSCVICFCFFFVFVIFPWRKMKRKKGRLKNSRERLERITTLS